MVPSQFVVYHYVGCGGVLVETMTFNRRVLGSTPTLATTQGPWASPLPALRLQLPVRFGVKLQYSIRDVVGSA